MFWGGDKVSAYGPEPRSSLAQKLQKPAEANDVEPEPRWGR